MCRARNVTRSDGGGRWEAIKNDPAKHEAWKAAKRNLRAQAKAARDADEVARLKRYREVKVRGVAPELGPDLTDAQQFSDYCRKLYESGRSTTQIASAVGRSSPGGIYTLLKKAGVVFRSRSEATRDAMKNWYSMRAMMGAAPKKIDGPQPEDVAAIYASGASLAATARLSGISVDAVRVRLRRAGVAVRSAAEQWALQFNPDGTPRNPGVAPE